MKCLCCGKEVHGSKCLSCHFDMDNKSFAGLFRLSKKDAGLITSLLSAERMSVIDASSAERPNTAHPEEPQRATYKLGEKNSKSIWIAASVACIILAGVLIGPSVISKGTSNGTSPLSRSPDDFADEITSTSAPVIRESSHTPIMINNAGETPDDEPTFAKAVTEEYPHVAAEPVQEKGNFDQSAPQSDFVPKSQAVQVPNVVGMEQAKATELLKSRDLDFQVWWNEGEAPTEPYYILEQSIPANSNVTPGTMVKLRLVSANYNDSDENDLGEDISSPACDPEDDPYYQGNANVGGGPNDDSGAGEFQPEKPQFGAPAGCSDPSSSSLVRYPGNVNSGTVDGFGQATNAEGEPAETDISEEDFSQSQNNKNIISGEYNFSDDVEEWLVATGDF